MTEEKFRDINPFEQQVTVCADEAYAKRYWFIHKEWIYFLPKEIAIPIWRLNKWMWRLGWLTLIITGIIWCVT
jgi:hypothetical protein